MQRTEWNPRVQHMGFVRQHLKNTTTSCCPNYGFDVRSVPAWDSVQVAKWIASIGMGQYSNTFKDYKVEGTRLLTMDSYKMQRMGIPSTPDIIFMEHEIRELNKSKRRSVCQIETLPYSYYKALNLGKEPPRRYLGELLHCCNPE